MGEELERFSKARDEEDSLFILEAVLKFGRAQGFLKQEPDGDSVDKRELPSEVRALIDEMERVLGIPVTCRIVKQ